MPDWYILQPIILVVLSTVASITSCEEFVMRQRREHVHHHQYGEEGSGGSERVDPHSGDHCVDVSYYANVTYRPTTEICCGTVMEKECKNKQKKVSQSY